VILDLTVPDADTLEVVAAQLEWIEAEVG